jgi:hypothetical protein
MVPDRLTMPDGSTLAEPRRDLGARGFDVREAAAHYGDPPSPGQVRAYALAAGCAREQVDALLRYQRSRGVVPPSWTDLARYLARLTAGDSDGTPPDAA